MTEKNGEITKSIKLPTDVVSLIKLLKDLGILGAVIFSFFLLQAWVKPDISKNTERIEAIETITRTNEKSVDSLNNQLQVIAPDIQSIKSEIRDLQKGQYKIMALLEKKDF